MNDNTKKRIVTWATGVSWAIAIGGLGKALGSYFIDHDTGATVYWSLMVVSTLCPSLVPALSDLMPRIKPGETKS
jgi:hypothetical protein